MKNIKKFFQKEDATKPTPDPVCPKQPVRNPRLKSSARQNAASQSPRRIIFRPGFSNDDCIRLRRILFACESVYGRRFTVADMFFDMLDKYISEYYPEIIPFVEQLDKIKLNKK